MLTQSKLIIRNSFFLLALLIGLHGSAQQAQQPSGSEVVMSPADLQSFIQKIATLKQERMSRHEKEQLLQEMEKAVNQELMLQQSQPVQVRQQSAPILRAPQPAAAVSPNEVNKDAIQAINGRLDLLMQMVETMRLQMNDYEYRRQILAGQAREQASSSLMPDEQANHTTIRRNNNGYAPAPADANRSRLNDNNMAPASNQTTFVNEEPLVNTEKWAVPDTVYIDQSDAGYQASVASGLSAPMPAERRQALTTTAPATNPKTAVAKKSEKERVRIVQAPPQTIYLNRDRNRNTQPVIIYRDRREKQQPSEKKVVDSSAVVSAQQIATEKKISSLETEISLLRELLAGAENDEQQKYNDDINRLKMQVSALTSELQAGKMKAADEATNVTPAEQLTPAPASKKSVNEISRVYFANNSTEIPASDFEPLREIVTTMKNDPNMLVLLRGFASSVGNPAYNKKIADKRAMAVQQWLMQNGVAPKNIITQGRGVDDSKSDAEARRVEITLLSK